MARRFSGHRLRTLRREAGISRTALAAAICRSSHSIYLWERGTVTPRADALGRLADALQCSVDDLLVDAGEACA